MAGLTAFPFSRTVTIDTTSSGANVSSSLTDFPVCVAVTSTSFGASAATHFFDASNTSGKRVQFYSGGTALSYEVESYDSAGQTAIYWVKVPTIAGTATTAISIGYGSDPNKSDQSNGTAVWSSSYNVVYHLAGTAAGTADATTNGNTLTFSATGVSNYTGLVGNSVSFNGSAGRGSAVTSASIRMDAASNFTISVLLRPDSLPTSGNLLSIVCNYDVAAVGSAANGGYDIRVRNAGGTQVWELAWIANNGNAYTETATETLSTTSDSYLSAVQSLPNWYLYRDGSQSATGTAATTTLRGVATMTKALVIGSFGRYTATGTDLGRYFAGKIGEVRISQTNRSADWVKAEYFSMKQTTWPGDGWITFGTETANARPYVLNHNQAITRSAVF